MPLARLLAARRSREAALAAYRAIVAQARDPAFYAGHGVPDTIDGRFELLALHAFLVLHRLKGEPEAEIFGQALFDVVFADMDRSLREMGVGDLSVGRQVKRMATGFYGRAAAYQAGLAGERNLEDAVRHNVFGTVEAPGADDVAWVAGYLTGEAEALRRQDVAALVTGRLRFTALG